MIQNLTDEQIRVRLDFIEHKIAECRDWKSLPALNDMFQKLIEEQARRDVERQAVVR